MPKEAFIFEVSDSSYGKYVLLNSHKVPVVTAFIAVWSEHCMVITDLFTELAREFPEEFVFAKVDIDQNPDLKERYRIDHVPTLIVFRDGEADRVETGVLNEDEARALLRDIGLFRASEEKRMQARALHMQGETPKAITLLAEAIREDPVNTRIALDMVQIFIDLEQYDEATALMERLPASARETRTGKSLEGQLWISAEAAKTDGFEKLSRRIVADKEDYDARFDMAIVEMSRHDYEQAMEQLFYIQEHNPEYREGAARETIITILNMMAPDNPDFAQVYRSKLANMLSH